jgi:hypothetical protein
MRSPATCERHPDTSEWRPKRSANANDEWAIKKPSSFKAFQNEAKAVQLERLESFRNLAPGWDNYDAEPPNEAAMANARSVLRVIWTSDTAPSIRIISPSVEGGVALVFVGNGRKYADIECFNDGEILAITSEGTADPAVWSIHAGDGQLRHAIEVITAFLNG